MRRSHPGAEATSGGPDQASLDAVSAATLELTRELNALEEVLGQLQVDVLASSDRLEAERAQCSRLKSQVDETMATAAHLDDDAAELEMNLRIAQRETTLVEQRAAELAAQVATAEREIGDAKAQLGTLHSTFANTADTVARMEYKIRHAGPNGSDTER
jgi:chromosome segregation ATPase